MRIIIVGAGAVGAYVGGYLARDGADVSLVDGWPAHVEAMRAQGLQLEGLSEAECFSTPVRALHVTDVQGLAREQPFDAAFVCVKSYDTAWATHLVRDLLAPSGFVVSLQNGINEDRIAAIVGWGRTVGMIASMIAVELYEPGKVRRNVTLGGEKHIVFRIGEAHGRITRNRALLERLDGLRTDERVLEEIARSSLGVAGEDEIVYVFRPLHRRPGH